MKTTRTILFLGAALCALAMKSAAAVSVPVYWDPVTLDAQGNPLAPGNLTGYRVYYATYSLQGMTTGQATLAGSVIRQNTGNVLTYSVPNLSNATTYYFRLTAFNPTNESDWSVQTPGPADLELSTCTPPAPQPPAAPVLNPLTVVSSSRIDASWASVVNVTGYRLERSLDGVTFSTVANVGTVTSYIDNTPPLSPSTQYYYRLFAKNAVGDSPASNTQNATTLAPPPPPAAPTNGTAAANSVSQITVDWSDNSTDEDVFEVVRSLSPSFTSPSTTTVTPANPTTTGAVSQAIGSLTAGTTYYFRVRAVNGGGNSGFTTTVARMTLPTPPSAPTYTGVSSTTLTVSWGNVTGEDGFYLERSLSASFSSVQYSSTVAANVTSLPMTGLTPGTWYYFRVRAFNGSGNGSFASSSQQTTGGGAGGGGSGTPAGLIEAYCYPNPARGVDPIVRALMGDVDSVEVTIFDQSGRAVHSGRATYPIQLNGETAYEYTWTGEKAPGVYYAVIHGKKGDKTIKARAKFAVVR